MTKTLELNGFTEFERAWQEIQEQAKARLKTAMANSLALLHDAIATYPPATEANQPGRWSLKTMRPMGYYERGRGYWYPVMKEKSLPEKLGKTRGAVKAKKITGVVGYKLAGKGTSELLGRKWTTAVTVADDGVTGEIGTNVSYADYVQGGLQNRIHRRRGWPALDFTVDRLAEDIMAEFDQLYYRLGQVYQANEHLDTKALGLLQAAGLILALIGALKFPAALYGNELWAKSGIAVGFFAFAGMVLLTLLAWKPADFPVPGPADWDKIYDDYVTIPIDQTFDQLLQDGLEVQRRLLTLNRHKASRLAGSTVLFAVQLAGLLLLALAS